MQNTTDEICMRTSSWLQSIIRTTIGTKNNTVVHVHFTKLRLDVHHQNVFPAFIAFFPNTWRCPLAWGTVEHLQHHWVSLCQVPGIEEQLPRKVVFLVLQLAQWNAKHLKNKSGNLAGALWGLPIHYTFPLLQTRTEMGKFHENKFPACFRTSPPWKSNISLR